MMIVPLMREASRPLMTFWATRIGFYRLFSTGVRQRQSKTDYFVAMDSRCQHHGLACLSISRTTSDNHWDVDWSPAVQFSRSEIEAVNFVGLEIVDIELCDDLNSIDNVSIEVGLARA